jgi:hypothetical protein
MKISFKKKLRTEKGALLLFFHAAPPGDGAHFETAGSRSPRAVTTYGLFLIAPVLERYQRGDLALL